MPPALLVRPEDALQSLRTAILLGSLYPIARACGKNWPGPRELVSVRKTITSERDKLAADRDSLRDDQTRLAALIDERSGNRVRSKKTWSAEGARAIALSQQVDSLQGLIAKMEQDLKSAAQAAATASLRGAPGISMASRIWAG